ncbi:twitch domain-containing radical SAM protein [Vicingaceae bacterium]|nr:twitch domain-containing radical SAM protein [Vicingaceae bacterium]
MDSSSHSEKQHFCILPWIHLHVAQNGRVSPCCNNKRFLGNVQEQSIKDIWNGKKFKEVREQFKNDIADKRCIHCYNIEKSGKKSLRQISNQKYKKDLVRVEEKNPETIYLDIRFSNICNFKCKTCWHGNSSAWFEEGSKRNASDERIIKAFTNNFDELFEYIDDVEEIYFAGGEPLIMEEHYQILEELERRELFDIELRYNTNFSNLNFKDKNILEIWKKFKKVHVSASIDASHELGSKIREGFNWEQFIINRKEMLAICPEIYFEISPTVSSLNIFNLSKLHQELVNLELINIDNIYLNFLERPIKYNLKSLSETDKIKVQKNISNHINWLLKNDTNPTIIEQFKSTLNYLE